MPQLDSPPTQGPRVNSSDVEAALRSAIDSRGPSVLFESERLRGDLEAACPAAKVEIALAMLALAAQVPQELLAVHSHEDLSGVLPRLAQLLVDRHALKPDRARWAVLTWARALGLSIPASFAALCVQTGVAAKQKVGARHWIALAFVLAAILIGVLALRPRMAPSAAPIASAPGALTPSSAVLASEITEVDSSELLAGDGKSRDVFVSFKANGVALRGIERRFVRGDVAWDPRPSIIELSREAIEQHRALVGTIALRTTRHATATFQYVLVAADGTRSAPFEKTFTIAPGLAQPSTMTAAATLASRSAVGTTKPEHVVRMSSPRARVASMAPVAACTRATCGSVVAVREIPSADVPRAEAASAKPRGRSTDRKARSYQTIIRMDDRAIHTITQAARWRVGSRVRMAGGKFVAIRSG